MWIHIHYDVTMTNKKNDRLGFDRIIKNKNESYLSTSYLYDGWLFKRIFPSQMIYPIINQNNCITVLSPTHQSRFIYLFIL